MGLCPHCGAKVEFCPSCGQPLAAGAAIATPPPAQSAGVAAQEAYQERQVWEGKPHIKAGIKSQTLTYRVTTERVQAIHTGLSKKIEEIELSRFKDVKSEQSLAQRMVGVGDVTVISSDPTRPVLVLEDVQAPEDVKELIRKVAREEIERLQVRRFANV